MPRSKHPPQRTTRKKSYTYTILIHRADRDETGYWVEVPALPGCFTQGETIEQCMDRARQAIEGHIESLVQLGQPIPEEPSPDDAVVSKIRVAIPIPA